MFELEDCNIGRVMNCPNLFINLLAGRLLMPKHPHVLFCREVPTCTGTIVRGGSSVLCPYKVSLSLYISADLLGGGDIATIGSSLPSWGDVGVGLERGGGVPRR